MSRAKINTPGAAKKTYTPIAATDRVNKTYGKNHTVIAHDKMSKYTYQLAENPGENLAFTPGHTPQQMLELGIFEGKYARDCHQEFPETWWVNAVESSGAANPNLNYFHLKSRLSLQEWRERGWIPICVGDVDVRGWFQWYMRYYLGRRMPVVDAVQIKRHNAIARHAGQVRKNCHHKGVDGRCTQPLQCRPRQRQTLLQWGYDCMI